MNKYTFEHTRSTKDQKFRFTIKSRNGEVVHASEKGFDTLEELLAHVRDLALRFAEGDDPEFYKDAADEHRWRLEPSEEVDVGCGAHEGFSAKPGAKHNFGLVREAFTSTSFDA